MFAYFCVGGKQYFAKAGDILRECPYLDGFVGEIVVTDQVLGINDVIGSPAGKFLKGAKVELKIIRHGKGKKLRIVNFKAQKRHEKWKGFRRKFTDLEVLKIHWSE